MKKKIFYAFVPTLLIMLLVGISNRAYSYVLSSQPQNEVKQVKVCQNCRVELRQVQRLVNKPNNNAKCTSCKGTGQQAQMNSAGKLEYNGPKCLACDGSGHPYKQVWETWLQCPKCLQYYKK